MKKLLICSAFILTGIIAQQADARLSCTAPEMPNQNPKAICAQAECLGVPELANTLVCNAPMISCDCTK